jgi:hypothetical protein
MTVRLQPPSAASARPSGLSEDEQVAAASWLRDVLREGLARKLGVPASHLDGWSDEQLWKAAHAAGAVDVDVPAAAAARRQGSSYRPPKISTAPNPSAADALRLQQHYRQPREAIRVLGPRPPKIHQPGG